MTVDYLRDPKAIYNESFATIRREADLSNLPEEIADIAVRLIHACGMTDIVEDIIEFLYENKSENYCKLNN